MPQTQVLLNFKTYLTSWLKTKHLKYLNYVLIIYMLLNRHGLLMSRDSTKIILNGKENNVSKDFFWRKFCNLLEV